jgi:hypothetical protein
MSMTPTTTLREMSEARPQSAPLRRQHPVALDGTGGLALLGQIQSGPVGGVRRLRRAGSDPRRLGRLYRQCGRGDFCRRPHDFRRPRQLCHAKAQARAAYLQPRPLRNPGKSRRCPGLIGAGLHRARKFRSVLVHILGVVNFRRGERT